MTPIEQELGKAVSKAVEQIVAAGHAAAAQALDAAFGRGGSVPRAASSSKQTTARTQTTRRSSEQIQVLRDSVY
ncbi:MAG: hypothetical protein GY811_10835 [Myxococcales bacterium]|nr:hypothetical protein [Myxococcales bacterium]